MFRKCESRSDRVALPGKQTESTARALWSRDVPGVWLSDRCQRKDGSNS